MSNVETKQQIVRISWHMSTISGLSRQTAGAFGASVVPFWADVGFWLFSSSGSPLLDFLGADFVSETGLHFFCKAAANARSTNAPLYCQRG